MKLKFLLGGLSALVAVGGIANLAQAQSSIGTVTPNTDAVLTIDQTDSLNGSTTDPLAIRGMQAHTATPTSVLVMEGEMVRSYPISSITPSGASDSLVANADGSYTHTAADGTEVTIAAPPAAATSSLTANADGSFTHNNGTGTEVIIPAAGSDSLSDNGDGTYDHTDLDGNTVTIDASPVEPFVHIDDPTVQADLGDSNILLPISGNTKSTSLNVGSNVLDATNTNVGLRLHTWSGNIPANNFDFINARLAIRAPQASGDLITIQETGELDFNTYGSGTFDSVSYARILGVQGDGSVIEIDPATLGGGSGATSTLTANADGSYTHDDGTGTQVTIPAANTSSLTANADGSFDHDDGTGNVTTIPAPAAAVTSSLTTTGGGIYEHSDGAATPTTLSFDTSNAWHPVSDTSASAVGSTAEDIIFDGGQVGIGVTPSEQLHVAGNALLTGNLYTNSDIRLKTNIVEFEGSLASLMEIEPVTFDWIDEDAHTSGTQLGFIAQDVQAALPEAVIVSEDELGTLSVADRPILAASIGAIQELKAENDALKAELEDMKSQMQQMELLQLAVMSMQAQLADMAQSDAMMKANFSL